jgi:hypothetical protein
MGKRNSKPRNRGSNRKNRRVRIPTGIRTQSCVPTSVPSDPPSIKVSSQKSVKLEVRILLSKDASSRFTASGNLDAWYYEVALTGTTMPKVFSFSFVEMEKMVAYRAGLTTDISKAPTRAQFQIHKAAIWGHPKHTQMVGINTIMPFPFGDTDLEDVADAGKRAKVAVSFPPMWSQVGTIDSKYGVQFHLYADVVPPSADTQPKTELALVQISGTVRTVPIN